MAYEHQDILPSNATALELAFAAARDPQVRLADPFEGLRLAAPHRSPPPAFLPFLVWQLGLGELTPYLPNLYSLIAEGVAWQRVCGTPGSVRMGFDWLGYDCTVHNHPVRRRYWNKFQTELDRVRDEDEPDLERLAGIGQLSVPERSIYWRGWKGWNVPPAEGGWSKFGGSIFGNDSGVRIPNVAPKWSFGRNYSITQDMSEAELTAIGEWIPEVPEGDLWVDADYPWVSADFLWNIAAAVARRASIALGLAQEAVWVHFRDGEGATIGYRKAAILPVKAVGSGGVYSIGGQQYAIDRETPQAAMVFCRTGFGDGDGEVSATAAVCFGGAPIGVPGGRLWLSPGQLAGGTETAPQTLAIEFGATVRERVLFLMRF